ncbi:MAG: hypothetical protein QXP53_00100 [Candidatus Pacearchaeota archaeon]
MKRGRRVSSKTRNTSYNFKSQININKVHHGGIGQSTQEKIILLLFLVFVILALIIMFKPQQLSKKEFTGMATSNIELEKMQFNASERLKGKLIFQIQQQDILPKDSLMSFFILTNDSKCPTKYVCYGGATRRMVDWHNNTQACEVVNPDPEGTCCRMLGANCTQIVLNSGFDAELNTGTWFRGFSNISSPEEAIKISSEVVGQDEEGNDVYSNVLLLDSSSMVENRIRAFASAKQSFVGTPRSIKISELAQVIENQIAYCEDSDAGGSQSYLINGTCKDPSSPQVHRDYCSNTDTLIENACAGMFCTATSISCSQEFGSGYVCYGGKCVNGTRVIPPITGTVSGTPPTIIIPIEPPPETNPRNEPVSGMAISEITGKQTAGNLVGYPSLEYNVKYVGDLPCAFEVVITSDVHSLHYYYEISSNYCPMPNSNNYIRMPALAEDTWRIEKINLFDNWKSKFGESATNENITNITLVSHSKFDGDYTHSQVVYFDYIKIKKLKEFERSDNCVDRNLSCCIAGTGYGDYYGEQLKCDLGYECWSKCTNFTYLKLDSFISNSNAQEKYNKTEGMCQAIVDGAIVELYDECYDANKGYTACLTNTSTCRGWGNMNIYEVNLSRQVFNKLKAPSENGTYEFLWMFSYDPINGGCYDDEGNSIPCLIFSKKVQFGVGAEPSQPQENWNCILWSSCVQGLQFSNCTETNSGRQELRNRTCCWSCTAWQPDPCPQNLTQTRTCVETTTVDCPEQNPSKPAEIQNCTPALQPCTEDDWRCEPWSNCRGGIQTRYCEKINDCSETGYVPSQQQSCRGGLIFKGMFLYIIIVAIAAVIVIFLFLKVLKKPTQAAGVERKIVSGKKPAYPEVVSYIKDALAAGASRQDIEQKLLEAGWPKDIIDESFASAR